MQPVCSPVFRQPDAAASRLDYTPRTSSNCSLIDFRVPTVNSQPSPAKPILVTGASGFIGSAVVRNLTARGRPVRCLVRATSRTERIDSLPVERVTGDILEPQALERATGGCAAIIHLAGISAWSQIDSPLLFPVVVDGTRNVLCAARAQAVPRVVYVSSLAALGPARSPEPRDETAPFDECSAAGLTYVQAKRQAEELCRNGGAERTEVVIVRPAEVYGPHDRDLVTAGNLVGLLKSRPIVVCPGGTSVVHVDDVAEGIVRALDMGRRGESYLLAGENLHHRELASLLVELAGRRARVITAPAGLLRLSAALARRLHLPFPIPPAAIPYATAFWFADNSRARRELGLEFRPARKLLSETLAWLRAAGHIS